MHDMFLGSFTETEEKDGEAIPIEPDREVPATMMLRCSVPGLDKYLDSTVLLFQCNRKNFIYLNCRIINCFNV